MKLSELYSAIIRKGIEKDPRSVSEVKKCFKEAAAELRKLKGPDRNAFDRERLSNPYSDTRILYGDPDTEVKTVLVGIDMEAPEILAADTLNDRGAGIDLVMAHHPEGPAWANLYDVMRMQASIFNKFGIPADVAKEIMKDRVDEVSRSLSSANHSRSVDMARLMNMPFMCAHTPADNHVVDHLQGLFEKKRPATLEHLLKMLKAIPEYADAMKKGAGPRLLVGEPKKKAGKIFVDMTGGTEGPKRILPRLSQAGVGTIVAMHLSEEHFRHAKSEHINVVIAGHIASDTLGLNLLLDGIEKREKLNIIPTSGFIRICRG